MEEENEDADSIVTQRFVFVNDIYATYLFY